MVSVQDSSHAGLMGAMRELKQITEQAHLMVCLDPVNPKALNHKPWIKEITERAHLMVCLDLLSPKALNDKPWIKELTEQARQTVCCRSSVCLNTSFPSNRFECGTFRMTGALLSDPSRLAPACPRFLHV